jgi:copper resistance protein C
MTCWEHFPWTAKRERIEAMRRIALVVAVSAVLVAVLGSAAEGHGKKVKTEPDRDDKLSSAPNEVSITLTEEPTDQAVVVVRDGCGEDVLESLSIEGKTMTGSLSDDARPGQFRVEWRVISAVDGHPTDGGFGFHVAGKGKCKGPAGGPDQESSEEPMDDEHMAADPADEAGDPAGDAGGFPAVPVALGTGGLVLLALVARLAGARR